MPALTRFGLAAVVAALVLASGGCSALGGAPKLDGTGWRLTEWSVSSIDPAEVTITAQFADGQIGGHSGVNSYGGSYETGSGGSFQVGEIVSTLIAGPEPAQRAETAYHELLKQARTYAVNGDTLTLSDANGNQLLIFSAAK